MPNTEPELDIKHTTASADNVVHVCVAVIQRCCTETATIQVLIAKRPDHLHQGGLWEFPGGKVEAGETIVEALDRELDEELGIRLPFEMSGGKVDAQSVSPLIQIQHAYPEKTVLLDVWKVHCYDGQLHGKEGQEVRWVPLAALNEYAFPQANLPIIAACLLPNRYFITPPYASVLEAAQGLHLALQSGAKLVYFRQPQLAPEIYANWVKILASKQAAFRQVMMLQSPVQETEACAGVHLSFRAASLLRTRPVSRQQWFAVSCHDEAELLYAEQLGADFVTLSPVLPTQTHPGAEGLGWSRFERLTRKAGLPVYGLGGLTPEHLDRLFVAGAQGLAGIRFWQSPVSYNIDDTSSKE